MNNFPAMTGEKRQELIADLRVLLIDKDDEDKTPGTLIARIALAALTNDGQALARKVWSDLDRMASPEPFMRAAYESVMRNYTAPPAPVLRVPVEMSLNSAVAAVSKLTHESRVGSYQDGWNACLAEVKRLNNQPAPPETSNEQ